MAQTALPHLREGRCRGQKHDVARQEQLLHESTVLGFHGRVVPSDPVRQRGLKGPVLRLRRRPRERGRLRGVAHEKRRAVTGGGVRCALDLLRAVHRACTRALVMPHH